jgi:predicted porin
LECFKMKKSLVALAVLAASGAALAQVSIKGNLTAGFKAVVTGATGATDGGVAVGSSGFGVDTAEVTFSATEDLGGGMKAGASMGLVNVVRGAQAGDLSTAGRASGFGPANTSVYVSGDFGRITLATARGTDYLTGGVASVGGTFQDGRALSNRDVNDSIGWSMPMGPLAVSVTYNEGNNAGPTGLGVGTSGTENGAQSNIALGLRYKDGPLVGDFGYAMYDEGQTGANAGDKADIRFAGSYDMGAFKVGGGWRQRQGKVGTRTDMGVSAAVPMGALTLSANWVQREYSNYRNTKATDGLNIGYGLSANYALSKRTAFIADYTAYTGQGGNVDALKNRDFTGVYNLFLSHSF